MEHQVNIIFILVFCFSKVEPIPYSEEGERYGAQKASNWPENQNQTRQYHNQNFARPQNFYPASNDTKNRNYNQDNRPYERKYDNRHSALTYGPVEKRAFYEGANRRNNRPYNQPPVLTTASGSTNFKEKSPLQAVPQTYRPTRNREYDDRNNGRYSPQVERNYQQPATRPYYGPRIPYRRSVSENAANRFKEYTQPQKPGYFDKQVAPQKRPTSPMVFRYPNQNRVPVSTSETLKPPNLVLNSVPPATQQPRNINNILSDPKIQKYLASNLKRYLILHSNGTMEHIDNLESIVQSYPNYVMIKAGDIITNPQNSSLKLTTPTPREEIAPLRTPEVVERIPTKQYGSPAFGYNTRVPYVTEKAYAQPIGRPVNIPHEDDVIPDDAGLEIITTPASIDSSTNFAETTTEYYTSTPFEITTEYGTLTELFGTTVDYDTPAPFVTTTEYATPIPFIETSTEYVTYSDSTTNFAPSTIPIPVGNEDHIYTQMLDILSEQSITDDPFLVATEEHSTIAPKSNNFGENLDNIMPTENRTAPQVETKNNMIPKLHNVYPSAFGKFIRRYFGPVLSADKLKTTMDDSTTSNLEDVEAATNPFGVTDIIDAITELAVTNLTTAETANILYDIDDSNTTFPLADDLIYAAPIETSSPYNFYEFTYPEATLLTSENEEDTNSDSSNPFANTSNVPNPKKKSKRRRNPGNRKTTEKSYYTVENGDNDDTSNLYTTTEYITNPFVSDYKSNFEEHSLSPTETVIYNTSNPFLVKGNEVVTNPFNYSATERTSKPRRRIRNKKKLKPINENYSEDAINPFIANTTSEYMLDQVFGNNNETISSPFVDTNPFNKDLQNSVITNYDDYSSNPFVENYSNEIVMKSPAEIPETDYTSPVFDNEENIYDTNIVPFAYLPTEINRYELNTTPIPDYDINSEFDDFTVTSTTATTTTEEGLGLTTTKYPTVWFKTDADFWEKLSNGTIPYDVVYFSQVYAQPVVEKDTKTTIYPNGTIVQEFIETVWEREGDRKPILVKKTKKTYPDEEP